MSKETTEQQIREHIRAAIQEIRNNINEDVAGAGATGGVAQVMMGAARGAVGGVASGAATAGTAGTAVGAGAGVAGTAAGAAAIPVVAAVVTAVALERVQHALMQGIFAYKEGANADEAAERNMMKSAVNRAWMASVKRRRANGEESDAGDLKKDIAAMRSWRVSSGGTGFDAEDLSAAIGRITKEEWDSSPVEADPGGYGNVEKAQEELDSFLSELPEPSDPVATSTETLSEVRAHIRNAINEVMVGMTPITRMPTQEDANTAMKGNNTNTAIDKAELGFNTFNMQEWASIAGIDEKDLSEALDDDTGNSSMLGGDDDPLDNVVDIGDPNTDSTDEIEGMQVSSVSGDSAWDDGLEDEVEDLADQLLADRETQGVESLYDFSRFLT